MYADNCFLTLTYADDNVGTLVPAHLRAFWKALRKRLDRKVRYYAVGEYGDLYGRPHYHAAIFNYPTCHRLSARKRGDCQCDACSLIRETWGHGFIINLPLEIGSARYIARYVLKKMTRWDDPRLGDRHPEFARMSLKPGIGAPALDAVANVIRKYNLLDPQGDVPVTLRHGSIEWPLGRYLRSMLREHMGLDKRAPHVLSAEASFRHYYSEENAVMRSLQKIALDDQENPSLKLHVLQASAAARLHMQRRHNIFETKGSL